MGGRHHRWISQHRSRDLAELVWVIDSTDPTLGPDGPPACPGSAPSSIVADNQSLEQTVGMLREQLGTELGTELDGVIAFSDAQLDTRGSSWLERCSTSPGNTPSRPSHRLNDKYMRNGQRSLPPGLPTPGFVKIAPGDVPAADNALDLVERPALSAGPQADAVATAAATSFRVDNASRS